MIRPVRHLSAFCHPDCEHRFDNKVGLFRFLCKRFGQVLVPVKTAGFVNAYVRDPWCVIEETEQRGALDKVPSTLLK